MALDIVVRLGQDGCDARPAAALLALLDDAARVLVAQRGRRGRVGARALLERVQRLLVGERAGAAQRVEVQRAVVGRRRLAEDEEFDEEEDDQRDRELAQQEALRERQPAAS